MPQVRSIRRVNYIDSYVNTLDWTKMRCYPNIYHCLGFYSANSRNYPDGLLPIAYQTGIMLVGLIFLLPCYLFEIQSGKQMQINMATTLTIGYVALFATILAFICWTRAIREVGANRAGLFIHLMPVFSTILAIIFLDETLLGYHVRGMSLVFMGIFIITFSIRKQKKDSRLYPLAECLILYD